MNFTTNYNRAHLQVVNPQLEQSVNDQRVGRKRFEVNKNIQSSNLSYGYNQNYIPKNSIPQEIQPDPSSYPPYPSSYIPSPNRQIDYKNNPPNLDQPPNFSQNPPKYYQNPEVSQSPYVPQHPDTYEGYSNPYSNSSYKDLKYPPQYEPPSYSNLNPPNTNYPKHPQENPENFKQVPQSEPNPELYYDEIEKLKQELRYKEEQLAKYSQGLNNTPPKSNELSEPMYSRINKAMFDKQRTEEQIKINSSTLDYQLNEKNRRMLEFQQEREREQTKRLEMLKRMKEDEVLQRMEKMQRVKEYREQLEVQSLMKNNIKNQERVFYNNDVQKPFEVAPSPQGHIRSNNSYSNVSYSPGTVKFTKKTPKTICYNPITGVLKDTAQYVYGSYPEYGVKDPSSGYLKNQSDVAEMAANPAFYQQKYTKSHPKVVASFPITGNSGVEDRGGEGDLYSGSEKHMAEYGQRMMQNRNLSYN